VVLQLVIPARNEAGRLPATLDALRAHVSGAGTPGVVEVVVVDNASTDDTARVAARAHTRVLPVRVLRCDVPGKGAAVRAGMAATTADVVGFMDADGATHLAALDDGLALLAAGADVALGSRAVPGSVTNERHSRVRVSGARLYRWCTRRVAPGVADTQCGFKLFRGDLGRDLFAALRSTGFSFDVEVIGRAQRVGAQVVEFPVTWDDVPGSSFDPLRHGASAFYELAAIARRFDSSRSSALAEVVVMPRRPAPRPGPGPVVTLAPAAEA
jgi:dolichyl-phosphate beta-glucosyltransferase